MTLTTTTKKRKTSSWHIDRIRSLDRRKRLKTPDLSPVRQCGKKRGKWSILLRTESTSIKRGFSRRRRVFSLADRVSNRLVGRFQSLKMLMMFFYYPTNIDSMMTGEYLARQHKPVKHAVDTDEICWLLSLFFVSSSVIARQHCWSSWTRPYVRQFCYFVITVSSNLLQTEAITTWCYWQHRTLQATQDFAVALNWLDRPFARSQ